MQVLLRVRKCLEENLAPVPNPDSVCAGLSELGTSSPCRCATGGCCKVACFLEQLFELWRKLSYWKSQGQPSRDCYRQWFPCEEVGLQGVLYTETWTCPSGVSGHLTQMQCISSVAFQFSVMAKWEFAAENFAYWELFWAFTSPSTPRNCVYFSDLTN